MTTTTTVLEEVACAVCDARDAAPARIRNPRDRYALAYGIGGGRSRWVVCRRCALVYQSPRPDQAAVEDLYLDGDYHRERGGLPEHYVQYSLRRSVPALDWMLGHLPDGSGRALDIGAGIGGALIHLRNHGWETIGVEPDDAMAALGRDRFSLDIRTGFFSDTTFADGPTFDFAYSCHVWEHLTDPVGVAEAARSALTVGGHLGIVVPTFRQARTMAWQCFSTPHNYMFTHQSLGNVLNRAGFDVVAHTYAADADSELWLVARVRDGAPAARQDEAVNHVQRELALVPLRAPLGWPGRARKHAATLAADPRDFVDRSGRRLRDLGGRLRRLIRR